MARGLQRTRPGHVAEAPAQRRWQARRVTDPATREAVEREVAHDSAEVPEPDEREAYRILDLALRSGEVLLSGGAGASDVTATVMALAHAYGLQHVECDITFTSITVSWVRAVDVAPITSIRLVRQRALDHTRLTEVHNLVDDVIAGGLGRAEASARLDAVRRARHPYRRWTVDAASATMAAAVTVLLGARPVVALAAFAATVVVARVSGRLAARNVPAFYQVVAGAAVATAVAVGLVALEVGVRPSLVVAGGIVVLLPGVTLVGSVQDAITGFYVTAAARAFETVLITAGIITGVAVVLYASLRLGVGVAVTAQDPRTLVDVPVQVAAAAVTSGAFALANYAPRRTLPGAALAGALAWAALIGLEGVGIGGAYATGIAAALMGFGAPALARRQKAPPVLYVAAGVIPLLPGLTIYRGMLQLAQDETVGGLVTLGAALSTGLALAAGAILGEFLAQPVRREVSRFERRIVGPRLAGPLAWRRRE